MKKHSVRLSGYVFDCCFISRELGWAEFDKPFTDWRMKIRNTSLSEFYELCNEKKKKKKQQIGGKGIKSSRDPRHTISSVSYRVPRAAKLRGLVLIPLRRPCFRERIIHAHCLYYGYTLLCFRSLSTTENIYDWMKSVVEDTNDAAMFGVGAIAAIYLVHAEYPPAKKDERATKKICLCVSRTWSTNRRGSLQLLMSLSCDYQQRREWCIHRKNPFSFPHHANFRLAIAIHFPPQNSTIDDRICPRKIHVLPPKCPLHSPLRT